MISSLECAATPQVFAFMSAAPLDTAVLPRSAPHHPRSTPHPQSVGGNNNGDEGFSALAAVLKETQITNLKCVAPLERESIRVSHGHSYPALTMLSPPHNRTHAVHQDRPQPDRRRKCPCAHCHPQGDADD